MQLFQFIPIYNLYKCPFSIQILGAAEDGGKESGDEEDETTDRVMEKLARQACKRFPLIIYNFKPNIDMYFNRFIVCFTTSLPTKIMKVIGDHIPNSKLNLKLWPLHNLVHKFKWAIILYLLRKKASFRCLKQGGTQ